MSTLYELVGVSQVADQKQIKKAFRKKAMEHHPDRGGNANSFAMVRQAYDVLSDPAKREYYDANGSAPPISNIEREAYTMLGEGFAQVAAQCKWKPRRYAEIIRVNLQNAIRENEAKIAELRAQLESLNFALPEPLDNTVENLFASAIEWQRNNIRTQIEKIDRAMGVQNEALRILAKFRDTYVEPAFSPPPFFITVTR